MRAIYLLLVVLTLPLQASFFRLETEVYGGYRWDDFEMKNPGIRNDRTIRDVARFDTVEFWEVGGRAEIDGPCNLFLNFDGKYGWIQHGSFRLKERFADEFQELNFKVHDSNIKGHSYELLTYFGYCFDYLCNKFLFSPLIGYVYYQNQYEFPDGEWGPFTPDEKPVEPFYGNLNNHSQGVSFGFDSAYFVFPCLRLFGNFRYEWLRYHASGEGNTALITKGNRIVGQQKFTNEADLRGPVVQVGGDYLICNFYMGALFEYRRFYSKCGSEKSVTQRSVSFENTIIEEFESEESVDLDHIRWKTKRVQVYIGCYF